MRHLAAACIAGSIFFVCTTAIAVCQETPFANNLRRAGEFFGDRGYQRGQGYQANGNLLVSKLNGNAQYRYVLSAFQVNGMPFEFTLTYNDNASYTAFMWNNPVGTGNSDRYWTSIPQNRPVWVLGINGFALMALTNVERHITRESVRFDNCAEAYENDDPLIEDAPNWVLTDDHVVWLLEGYDYCNRMRPVSFYDGDGGSVDNYTIESDEIKLLQADGSVLTLVKYTGKDSDRQPINYSEADHLQEIVTGVYVPRQTNTSAYAVVTTDPYLMDPVLQHKIVQMLGHEDIPPHFIPRWVHYYTGDGLAYVFREWKTPYGDEPFFRSYETNSATNSDQTRMLLVDGGDSCAGPSIFYLDRIEYNRVPVLSFDWNRHNPVMGAQVTRDNTRGHAHLVGFEGHLLKWEPGGLTLDVDGRRTTIDLREEGLYCGTPGTYEPLKAGSLPFQGDDTAPWDEPSEFVGWTGLVKHIFDHEGRATTFTYEEHERKYTHTPLPTLCPDPPLGGTNTPGMIFKTKALGSVTDTDKKLELRHTEVPAGYQDLGFYNTGYVDVSPTVNRTSVDMVRCFDLSNNLLYTETYQPALNLTQVGDPPPIGYCYFERTDEYNGAGANQVADRVTAEKTWYSFVEIDGPTTHMPVATSTEIFRTQVTRSGVTDVTETSYDCVGGLQNFTAGQGLYSAYTNVRLPVSSESFTIVKDDLQQDITLPRIRYEFEYDLDTQTMFDVAGTHNGEDDWIKGITEWMYGRAIQKRTTTKLVSSGAAWTPVSVIEDMFVNWPQQCSSFVVRSNWDKHKTKAAFLEYAAANSLTAEQMEYEWHNIDGTESWFDGEVEFALACSAPFVGLLESSTLFDATGTTVHSRTELEYDEQHGFGENQVYGKVTNAEVHGEQLTRSVSTAVSYGLNVGPLSYLRLATALPSLSIGPAGEVLKYWYRPLCWDGESCWPSWATSGTLAANRLARGFMHEPGPLGELDYQEEEVSVTGFGQLFFEQPTLSERQVRKYKVAAGGIIVPEIKHLRTATEYGWFGKPVRLVDENNNLSAFEYDGIGRMTTAWQPGDFPLNTETNDWHSYSIAYTTRKYCALKTSWYTIERTWFSCDGECDDEPEVGETDPPLSGLYWQQMIAEVVPTRGPICPCYTPPPGTPHQDKSNSRVQDFYHGQYNDFPVLKETSKVVVGKGEIHFNRGEHPVVTSANLRMRFGGIRGQELPVIVRVEDDAQNIISEEELTINSASPNMSGWESGSDGLVLDVSSEIENRIKAQGVPGSDPETWIITIEANGMTDGSVEISDVCLELEGVFWSVEDRSKYDFTLAMKYTDAPGSASAAVDGGKPSTIMFAKVDDKFITSDADRFPANEYGSRHSKSMSLFSGPGQMTEFRWNYLQDHHDILGVPEQNTISKTEATYNGLSQVLASSGVNGFTVNRTYDAFGRMKAMSSDPTSIEWTNCDELASQPDVTPLATASNVVLYGTPDDPDFKLTTDLQALFNGYCRVEVSCISPSGSPEKCNASYYDARGRLVLKVASYDVDNLDEDLADPVGQANGPGNDRNLVEVFGYDDRDRLIWHINPKRQVTQYWYDDFGRVRYEYHPDKGVTSYAYDQSGRVRFVQNQQQADEGRMTFFEYDDLGRITLSGEAFIPNTVAIVYGTLLGGPFFENQPMEIGPLGVNLFATNPNPVVYTRFTDRLDALKINNGVTGDITRNKTILQVPQQQVPVLYPQLNVQPGFQCVELFREAESDRFSPALAFPAAQTFVHNAGNWPEPVPVPVPAGGNFENVAAYPEHALQGIWYDEFPPQQGTVFGGLPAESVWNNLLPLRQLRNLKGRPVVVAYRTHGGQPFHYIVTSYDERGRVEAMLRYTENIGFDAVYYSYNSMNKVVSVHTVDALNQHATWYGYDANGRAERIWTALDQNAGFGPGNTPQLGVLIEKPTQPVAEITVDDRDLITAVDYPQAGVHTEHYYNSAGQNKGSTTTLTANSTTLFQQRLSYNDFGLIKSQCISYGQGYGNGEGSWLRYDYDRVNRLVNWGPLPLVQDNEQTIYSYDQIGNRLTEVHLNEGVTDYTSAYEHGTQAAAHAGPNWLTTVTSAMKNDEIGYNANGAMTQRERQAQDGAYQSHRLEEYRYDPQGLIKLFTVRHETVMGNPLEGCEADASGLDPVQWSYRFNPMHEREQKRQTLVPQALAGKGLAWTYDIIGLGKRSLASYHGLEGAFCNAPAGSVTLWAVGWNTYGAGGVKVITRPDATREYVVSDHLGSSRVVFGETGNVLQRNDYLPFGGVLATAGEGAREDYIGRATDAETGLGSYGVRLYEEEYGRFLSVDPMRSLYSQWNSYQYALCRPVSLLDDGGMLVRAMDAEARLAIMESVHSSFWDNIVFDDNGVLDVAKVKAAAEGQPLDDNIAILSRLAENPIEIQVNVAQQFTALWAGKSQTKSFYHNGLLFESYEEVFFHPGVTLLPRREPSAEEGFLASMAEARMSDKSIIPSSGVMPVSKKGVIEVFIAEKTPWGGSRGRRAAHELYGHVRRYILWLAGIATDFWHYAPDTESAIIKAEEGVNKKPSNPLQPNKK